jgi:5-methylcytosine-specific restriction endonuclease McrA
MDRSLYPPNWNEISTRIRFQRAGGVCEECGAVHGSLHPETGSRVVLTTAHLDHNPANCADNNLMALCQRCHLRYDAKQHALNAAITRRRKLMAAGQMELAL